MRSVAFIIPINHPGFIFTMDLSNFRRDFVRARRFSGPNFFPSCLEFSVSFYSGWNSIFYFHIQETRLGLCSLSLLLLVLLWAPFLSFLRLSGRLFPRDLHQQLRWPLAPLLFLFLISRLSFSLASLHSFLRASLPSASLLRYLLVYLLLVILQFLRSSPISGVHQ